MFLTGFGMIVQTASGKTVLRTIAEEDKRGRVMSFYAMALPLLRKIVRPIYLRKGIILEEPREVWPPNIHIDGA
jgi:hypothetical protein